MLLRNEEIFVEQAVRNVLGFCDELIFADDGSTDQTPEILQRLVAEFPEKCRLHRLKSADESQQLIAPYIGADTWIFRVDGDELYDASRLAKLRKLLVAGECRQHWVLLGNNLNCVELDRASGRASGYLSPPARPATSLFNFAAIEGWRGVRHERLHGGEISFKAGYHAGLRCNLYERWSFEDSLCRCLHVCFLRRSSLSGMTVRQNILELKKWRLTGWVRAQMRRLRRLPPLPSYKEEKYKRGELVTVDATPFFS